MSVSEVLAASEPESDPDREGWRMLLAVARSLAPRASVDVLVDLAISFAPSAGVVIDRRAVQDVALTMMVTAKDAA